MADVNDNDSGFAALDAKLEADFDAIPDNAGPAADVAAPEASPAQEAPPPAETVAPTAAPTAAPPASDPSPGQTPAQSKDVQDAIAKYGSIEAAARALWDLNNRAAQLARENEEYKTRTAQPQAPPAEAKAPEPAPIPQELQRYDQETAELDGQWKAAESDRVECLRRKAPITRERERIGRQIIDGSLDLDRQEVARARYNELLAAEGEFDAEIKRLEGAQNEYVREFKSLKKEKAFAERLYAQESARQAEINRQNEASLARFGSTFFGYIGAAVKDIPEEYREDFKEEIKDKALIKLGAPGLDLDTQDVPGFVNDFKAKFLAKLAKAEKVAQAKYAENKTADVTLKAPEGKNAVAPVVKTSKFANREELEAHIEQGLGL